MKKWIIVMLYFNFIFLSGCWDMRELNELGFVMAVGIDKGKDPGTFRVTAQIAKPSNAGSNQGGSKGENENAVYIASSEGETIFDAIRNLAKFTSRRIIWAHNNVIIIGESLARQDITPVIDFFTHNYELRMRTWVAVCKGEAMDYVNAKTGMEDIPGVSISSLYRYAELPAESVRTELLKVFRDFTSDTVETLISALRLREDIASSNTSQKQDGEKQIELTGAAVFKKTRMVGWVSPEEARGLGLIRNEINSAIIVIPFDEYEGKKVSVEVDNIKTSVISDVSGSIPAITIKVKGKGNIVEQDMVTNDMSIDVLKSRSEELVNKEVEKSIMMAVDKVQKKYNCDVLAFGRAIHIQHKNEWYEKIAENWDEIYPQIPVTVKANIDIHWSYLYQRPMKVEKMKGENEVNEIQDR